MDYFGTLSRDRILAILRGEDANSVIEAAQVLAAAGMQVIEVTFTVPQAPMVISRLREQLPDHFIGAGTLTTPRDVADAVSAGAQFLVTPGTTPRLADALGASGLPFLPGVLTPSEMMTAYAVGARAVKLFPATTVGTGYIQHLRGPFPDVQIVPSGGVALREVRNWLERGALAVGLSSALCSAQDAASRSWNVVRQRLSELTAELEPV